MNASSRGLMAAVVCSVGVVLWHPASGAERTTKTAKECGEELQRNEAALEKAGESASAFFHRCWYHSDAGMPTPINEADASPAAPSGAISRQAAATHPSHPIARRHLAEHRFHPRRDRDDEGVVEAETVYGSTPPLPPPLPNQVNVNVPAVGSVSIPILPLPGLAATVRDVVDHPVVPGLVTASP